MQTQRKSYAEENTVQQPKAFSWEASLQKGQEWAIWIRNISTCTHLLLIRDLAATSQMLQVGRPLGA